MSDQFTEEIRQRLAAVCAACAERAHDEAEEIFSILIEKCESPIEQMFILGLLHCSDANGTRFFYQDYNTFGGFNKEKLPHEGIHVYYQVEIGKYRVDFVLDCVIFGYRHVLVVECDGHDFHEKTKEQAARDKARDRWLTSQGFLVLRYAGSEIFRNAEHCAFDAVQTAWDLSAQKAMAAKRAVG